MGREGRKVDNEIINRYFERAVRKHECLDDREEFSPRAPRRSFSGQNLAHNEAHHCGDGHNNSDPRDDSSPSVATRPFPPPYPPPGSYPVVAAPTWAQPAGGAPYPVWQPAAPARKDCRTNPIPPPPPPVPPPPPPPPPRGWPCESPVGTIEGEPGKGEIHDLLVAWYWAGYHAGMFAATQKAGK